MLTRSVGRLPPAGALALAAAVYVGFGLVLPLGAGESKGLLVLLNVMGVAVAWTITLAWLLARTVATRRRHLLEWTTVSVGSPPRSSSGSSAKCSGERAGTSPRPVARRPLTGTSTCGYGAAAARCVLKGKRWSSTPVGIDEVRTLAGTVALVREGLPGNARLLVTLAFQALLLFPWVK